MQGDREKDDECATNRRQGANTPIGYSTTDRNDLPLSQPHESLTAYMEQLISPLLANKILSAMQESIEGQLTVP